MPRLDVGAGITSMLAQATLPHANLASFLVGPEPKYTLGSTWPLPGYRVTLQSVSITILLTKRMIYYHTL